MKIGLVGSIHELGWEVLRSQGHSIVEVADVSANNLKKELADVSGIVLRTAQMPNEVIDACPNLQIVARHGVGYDNVDLNYLNKKKNCSWSYGYCECSQCGRACNDFFFTTNKKYTSL